MASAKTSLTLMSFVFLLLGLIFASYLPARVEGKENQTISRNSFPTGFIFGAGSAAYQYEGAVDEDGRGPSIWDNFTHQHSEKIKDGSNGDVANDFYHRYKDDIKLAKEMGLDSFRFSISWSRILPRIKPFATIFHWDLPQALEDEYGGFLSPKIVDDFRDYANIVFKEFGDKVKYWATLNEPNLMSEYGYARGLNAPGRCSNYIGNCSAGNSATEPYVVAHNFLLCHAATIQLYRNTYKMNREIRNRKYKT